MEKPSPSEPSTSKYLPRTLVDCILDRLVGRVELARELTQNHGKQTIHSLTVENIMGGLRGVPSILWEISEESPFGIKYHGLTIQELSDILPRLRNSEQMSPEATLWYFYSGTVPTETELEQFTTDLVRRCELPETVMEFCDSLPRVLLPETQMHMALATLSPYSKVTEALSRNIPKSDLWIYALEDALDFSARFLILAARIYSNTYRQGKDRDVPLDTTLDLAENFARRIGRQSDKNFVELIRLAWVLHLDHGCTVSSHISRLCSSALTDIYSAGSAALLAAGGVLHAAAIKRAVEFNISMTKILGDESSDAAIEDFVMDSIEGGRILFGFGHAVLRGIDPRFQAITKFIAEHPPPAASPNITRPISLKLLQRLNGIAPNLLRIHMKKMSNPAPNVDALSGSTLYSYGLEVDFLLLFMACGRTMGISAQMVWDRGAALGLPMERPLGITLDEIFSKVKPSVTRHKSSSVKDFTPVTDVQKEQ